jgi:4,5-dihydroxyphthalate decarboxylase
MLLAGELDATVGVSLPAHPDLRPLFPDAAHAEASWSGRTGLSPVNHVLVVKEELVLAHPWLKQELLQLFDAARQAASRQSGRTSPAFGVEANRAPIEAASRYAYAQGIVPRTYTADELFTA